MSNRSKEKFRVKTKKKKISNITLFADKSLDLRASLTVYEEDVGNLTYHLHDLLMAAWERRDDRGGIAIPGLVTGVRVDMVKQVSLAFLFIQKFVVIPFVEGDIRAHMGQRDGGVNDGGDDEGDEDEAEVEDGDLRVGRMP